MTLPLTQEQIAGLTSLANMLNMGVGQKNTPGSTTLTAPTLHGPFPGNAAQYGIFARPGIRPGRFSTLARPDARFVSALAVNRSMFTTEKLEIMTGVTAGSGTNASGWCATPPTIGQGKICEQNYVWGNYAIKTQLDAIPQVGEMKDRADLPADLLNSSENMNPFIPSPRFSDDRLTYLMWLAGVEMERSLERVLFLGNTATAYTSTETGWTKEFLGLDLQIKTGHTDAVTAVACPAADSGVITFGADIGSTIGGGDGRNIVEAVSDLYFGLKDRASKYQMEGVQWVIVIRPEMWRPLVENWSCEYATYRCSSDSAGQPFVNDVQDTNRLRLEMLNGNYLLVEGEAVPVYFCEGIDRTNNATNNNFTSDLYIVPVNWNGLPLTRVEYFPMDNPEAQRMIAASSIRRGVVNNGMWLMASEDTAFCTEFHFASRMRIILETPHLAGRVDNLSYTFRAPIRNAQPGDSYFYDDGGGTYTS